jgi:foldase protein PrsA
MNTKIFVLIPATLAALLLAGCGSSGSKSVPSDAVAVVGDDTISKSDFDTLLNQAKGSYKQQHRPFPKPGSQDYTQLRGQIMQFLIQRSEFDQKGKDLGITVSDKQVDQRLGDLKQQYFKGNEKKYLAQLKAQGYSEDQVKQNLRSQLLSEAIYKNVTSKADVSDAEIKAYYDDHKKQYQQPESRDVRHILLKSKAQANKIYSQLKAGANFAKLAKKYSQDPGSKALGGKLTISRGQTVAAFDRTAFSLAKGKMSRPVKTSYGYHIIQALSAVRPATVTPFSQVKTSIKTQLLQTKKQKEMTSWVDETRKDFCGGKLSFQAGFKPTPDPCSTSTTGSTGASVSTG